MSLWERIARETTGDDYAERYAARFRAMAERGQDTHGEATFLTGLVGPSTSVLDAGCGTGRIAGRLAELGHDVVGLDVDATMLAVARRELPDLEWVGADLATFDLGRAFDVVLVAGNTIPLLEPGTLPAAAERLTAHLVPGGRLVCGFGLDAAHLPGDCPVTPLADVDAAFGAAGLEPVERWSTWDRATYDESAGYVVTVHRHA